MKKRTLFLSVSCSLFPAFFCINPFNPLWKQIDLLTHSTSLSETATPSMASFCAGDEFYFVFYHCSSLLCRISFQIPMHLLLLPLFSVTVILSVWFCFSLSFSLPHKLITGLLFSSPSFFIRLILYRTKIKAAKSVFSFFH